MSKTQASPEDTEAPSEIRLGRLGYYLGFRMRRVHDFQVQAFHELTGEFDLRQGMFSALSLIASNPGISQQQVGDEIGQDKSAMVAMVDDLERRGWVRRERSTSDRRRYHLHVTPGGKKALGKLIACMEIAEAPGLAALSPSELTLVNTLLDKVFHAYRNPAPIAKPIAKAEKPKRKAAR